MVLRTRQRVDPEPALHRHWLRASPTERTRPTHGHRNGAPRRRTSRLPDLWIYPFRKIRPGRGRRDRGGLPRHGRAYLVYQVDGPRLMPKGRHLKPDFFTDKNIVGMSPLARLLYQG